MTTTQAIIAERGLTFGMHAKQGFKEIVQRNHRRYEMPFGMDDTAAFQSPQLVANPRLVAVLDAILGDAREQQKPADPAAAGAGAADPAAAPASAAAPSAWRLLGRSIVQALPGALEQQWHADGGHVDVNMHRPCHVLNVFMPLVDVTENNGPTEMRPGGHFLSRDLTRLTLLAKVKKTLRAPVRPCPRAGDALLFDYRTLHRGRAK